MSKITLHTPEQAAHEILRRRRARNSLIDYCTYVHPSYVPDPFHYLLADRLEKVDKGEIDRLMIFTPPRHGKLCAHATPVFTLSGWKTHGDLKVGDYVFSPSGKPIRVMALSEEAPANMRVELTNGDVIYCHENHEWTIFYRSKKTWMTVPTSWFVEPTSKGRRENHGKPRALFAGDRAQTQLPMIEALKCPEVDLPMHPYVFGAWLGDGTTTASRITHANKDSAIIWKVQDLGYVVSARHVHETTGVISTEFGGRRGVGGPFHHQLRALDVFGNKHIPAIYKTASIEQRLELLAGLIDTDGHVAAETSRVRFSTASLRLANDVADVARSMGWRTGIVEAEPGLSTSGIQGRQVVYQVCFNPDRAIPVALERKQIKRFAQQRAIGIRSVTHDPQGYVGRCIQVDSEDGLYLVGRQLNPTHNSELANIKFLSWFMARNPGKNVIQASYNVEQAERQSRFSRNAIMSEEFSRVFPEVNIASDSRAVNRWMLDNGQEYFAVGVGTGATGKGGHCIVIDDPLKDREEADSESRRQTIWDWYNDVIYTRLERKGAIILIQTRWHFDDLAGRLLDKMENDPESDRWHVLNLPALCESEDDPLGRKIGEALSPNRRSEAELERMRANLPDRTWSALYQQRPMSLEGAMFNPLWFEHIDTLPHQRTRVRAWDLASTAKGDYTVGVLMSKTRDGMFIIEDVKRARLSAMRVEQLILSTAQSDPRGTKIIIPQDPGQAGMAQSQNLIRRLAGFNVRAVRPSGDKVTMATPFAAQCEGRNVKLKPADWNRPLLDELATFPLGTNDDQVDALSSAFNSLLEARRAAVIPI